MPGTITFASAPVYKLPMGEPFTISVTLAGVTPLKGQQINWSSAPAPGITFSTPNSHTDDQGIATVRILVANAAGNFPVKVTATLDSDSTVTKTQSYTFVQYAPPILVTDKVYALNATTDPAIPTGHGDETIVATFTLKDASGNAIAGVPVTWTWSPSVLDLTLFQNDVALIPQGGGWVTVTDARGQSSVQVMVETAVTLILSGTVASLLQISENLTFATVDESFISKLQAPYPINISHDNVDFPPDSGPNFYVQLPDFQGIGQQERIFFVANNKFVAYDQSVLTTSAPSIVPLPDIILDFSPGNYNKLAYFIQDFLGNTTQSLVARFTVSGEAQNKPAAGVRRIFQQPHLDHNAQHVDVALAQGGLHLTIESLTGFAPTGSKIRANMYFNGWEKDSSTVKQYLYTSEVLGTITSGNKIGTPFTATCPEALAMGYDSDRNGGTSGTFYGEFFLETPSGDVLYSDFLECALDTQAPGKKKAAARKAA